MRHGEISYGLLMYDSVRRGSLYICFSLNDILDFEKNKGSFHSGMIWQVEVNFDMMSSGMVMFCPIWNGRVRR